MGGIKGSRCDIIINNRKCIRDARFRRNATNIHFQPVIIAVFVVVTLLTQEFRNEINNVNSIYMVVNDEKILNLQIVLESKANEI